MCTNIDITYIILKIKANVCLNPLLAELSYVNISRLSLPLSPSSTTSREMLSRFSNSRLVLDEDDLKWVKKLKKIVMHW